MAIAEPAKIYNVSGGGSSTNTDSSFLSSSLPDLLRRHGSSNKRKQRKSVASINNQLSKIELLQDFEFPEASNKIKSTRDGQYIVATGTYKPQMRVWECEQLSLKFERHSDAENVDFVMLSDDWTKSIHLQSDRTLELHNQGGHHARVRIPKFGRALNYHYASATALVGAAGNEVFRLNLDQGKFLAPFQLSSSVTGVNAVDVNPAHGLCAFGVEGGTNESGVELWDNRSRTHAGILNVATRDVLDSALIVARRGLPGVYQESDEAALLTEAISSLSATALSTSSDGLNIAVGTSTGHVLLYDLRMAKPYATKDQGFGLPIKTVTWPSDSLPMSEKRVLSSDSKVIKVWSPSKPSENMVTITPSVGTGDLNDVHHLPGTGLILSANESTRCNGWYVPDLGVAPKWCSFLDVLTDEADAEATGGKGTYEDFKFVDQGELERLGLSHLVGSEVLRPYMHGFFISLNLYDKARLISNPTAYEDARERAIKNKIEKLTESRIRETPRELSKRRKNENELQGIRINRQLAEKVQKQAERQKKGGAKAEEKRAGANLLSDDRFKDLFTNAEYQVDENSREYALLNPSTAVAKAGAAKNGTTDSNDRRKLTAVEEEELESDRESLDPDQESEEEEEETISDADSDSSEEGNLGQYDPRLHYRKRRTDLENAHERGARPVDDEEEEDADFGKVSKGRSAGAKKRTFGERMRKDESRGYGGSRGDDEQAGGEKSFSWTPSEEVASAKGRASDSIRPKKQETFGKGLSKGAGSEEGVGVEKLSKDERFGREKRRKPNRSASKNAMRSRT
ncbi:hypothetical protein CBS101457_000650 [Exobasidium rhododendri]|nr:hypothetical protein CBS101457_000650 [Exobasidium rhododendri]